VSDPKRYSNLDVWKALHFGEGDEGWVKWEDYARLKEKSECQAQCIDAFDKKLREAEAEVARLKTENSGLRAGIESLERVDNKIIARLKEENEQLFFASQGSVKYVDHQMAFARQATEHHKEMDRLKAEIERLTADLKRLANAGDIMRDEIANHLVYNKGLKVMNEWQSAKEVQS
jgi:SMC interacting uncharacterized protein involved in chromosome segregation